MRKLPVYIAIDVSESMIGQALDQVNRCLDNMIGTLRRNPYALETAWLSIITFDSKARVAVPLTELIEFQFPKLAVRPGTSLGAAIDLLRERIAQEVAATTAETKGDWRPIVFFLTDGQPTDAWRQAAQKLKSSKPRPSKIYAFGLGDEIDFALLKEVADYTFRVGDATPERMSDMFAWISSSIQTQSRNVHTGADSDEILPPKGIELVKDELPDAPKFPRQIFFHGVCSKTKKNFLARYKYADAEDAYWISDSYPIPDDFFADVAPGTLPTVDVTKILGQPKCPHCETEGWLHCVKCGGWFCYDLSRNVGGVCPCCGMRFGGFADASGNVARSLG
ncbi:MAG: VWA domain-containing protein [Thermoguttaceae bacterium]|nr:VWA domain-containing protein [Thermoguttaceae bacterium]